MQRNTSDRMNNSIDDDFSAPSTSGSNHTRFSPVSTEEIMKMKKDRIPQKTQEKVGWAVRLFREWHSDWKIRMDDEVLKVYKDVEDMDCSDLNHCLIHFLPEIRKRNGDKYPPRTQKELVAGIQHYFNYSLDQNFSIFVDKEFKETREILDVCMKKSAAEGFTKPVKRAAAITLEDEEKMWKTGVFGTSNPRQLLDTLIYHFGLNFALRACQEHRELVFGDNSQISLETDSDGFERLCYVERISKNNSCGTKDRRKELKVTYLYQNENKSRCIVSAYKLYLHHRPESNDSPGSSAFYLTPIPNPKSNIWYKNIPVGINTISKTLGRLMRSINDENFYSNTSLRRTAKTRLVEAGVSKEFARRKTGHFSSSDMTYVDSGKMERQMCLALTGKRTEIHVEEEVKIQETVAENQNQETRLPTLTLEKNGCKVKVYL